MGCFKWFRRRPRPHKPTNSGRPDVSQGRDTADSPEIQPVVQISGAILTNVGRDYKVYNGPVTEYKAQNIVIERPRATSDWPQLKELVSWGATHDSAERNPPPRCHPGTREAILKDIQAWCDAGTTGEKILWLHGPAGAGKSAIAQTIAETWAQGQLLAASFFFSRSFQNRSAIKYLFPTIAVQIALAVEPIRHRLEQILVEDPAIANRKTGAVDLIVQLFEGEIETPKVSPPCIIIIDGLDECQGNEDQSLVLKSVVDLCRRCRLPLRFFIVSRPEPHLKHTFGQDDLRRITQVKSLYGDEGAREDVTKYLRSEFSRIYLSERHRDTLSCEDEPWPSGDAIKQLVAKSGGYFIHAATVIRYIDEEYCSPMERLEQVLGVSTRDQDSSPFAELDKLYLQVLLVCPGSRIPVLKKILGFILFFDILSSVYHIQSSLRLKAGEVLLTLRGLHSLIKLDPDTKTIFHITSHHASFHDFLLDPSRSGEYHLDRQEWFEDIFQTALALQCNRVGVHVLSGDYKIPTDDDDSFVKSAPFQLAQMCLRLCPNLVPYMETMRRAMNLGPSDEGRLSPHDFWSTIEGLLRLIRVFNQRDELSFSEELTKRCDSMLQSRLSRVADSPEEVQYVQVMITLHCGFPSAASISDCKEWPALLTFTKLAFGIFPEIDDTLGMQHCLESPETLDFLEGFQLEPARSGIFYNDAEVRHTFVATRLIQSFNSRSDPAADSNSAVTALLFQVLEYHIELARPGDIELMAQLRSIEGLPKQVYDAIMTPEFRAAVISWLKKWPNPPCDMLTPWES